MDYCALATARSIPVAQEIAVLFETLDLAHEVGPLRLNVSGCINACGHHHVADIGILGLERAGVETYQITLGGDPTDRIAIGERTGPGFAAGEIVGAVERIVMAYLERRDGPAEGFADAYRRLGLAPFQKVLYSEGSKEDAA
ncbi:hypothetical protein CCR90_09175 [Rhodovulum sulfidophilum]|nr:hypothetical protein [Rhodovulum sulfidophilum]